ncbi:MAG: serine aminopeptidase domain-containing protein [Lysobacteraceae bacterium]
MSPPQAQARERVVPLRPERPLVAIATDPPAPRAVPDVLLVNAGVIHRIGPHRLHVRLARRLAETGHRALRLDLSGIGDSGPIPDRLDFRTSAVADLRAALDNVTASAQPTAGAIVFGLCSGADNALAAAAADPRIVGLVLVDPPAYATPQARRRVLRARLGDPRFWATLPARIARRLRQRRPAAGDAEGEGSRQPPPQAEYGRQLRALADRGVRVLAVYTAAQGVRFNHPDPLFEAFPDLRGRIDVRLFDAANHTFTPLAQQAALIDTIADWCRTRFPDGD